MQKLNLMTFRKYLLTTEGALTNLKVGAAGANHIRELPSHNKRSIRRTRRGSSRRKSLHKQTSAISITSIGMTSGSSHHGRVSNWSLQSVPSSSDLFLRLNAERQRQDKEIPVVPLYRVLRFNAKEWWIIILGLIGAAFAGSLWPILGILFGEIIRTFSLPPDQVLNEVNLWAGLYMVIGLVAGTGVFMQVSVIHIIIINLRIPYLRVAPLSDHIWS